MKCNNCGYETEQEFSYCPQCGATTQQPTAEIAPAEQKNSVAEIIQRILRDQLFLLICILMSVSCGVQLVGSGPNVLSILFTIFLWLAYAQGRTGTVDAKHLRCISGTVYAQYVIVNVGAILVIVIGIILGFAFGTLANNLEIVTEVLSSLDLSAANIMDIQEVFSAVGGTVIFVIFALTGAAMLVLNLFSNRYLHRFAKSVYQSMETGTLELKHTKAAYAWLYVFGIFSGLSLLGNIGSGDLMLIAADLTGCAMPIFAAVLIKKYFMTEQ
jgi:hypothetical protein